MRTNAIKERLDKERNSEREIDAVRSAEMERKKSPTLDIDQERRRQRRQANKVARVV